MRITYVTMAVVPFGLSRIAGDSQVAAMTGFALVMSLLGAFIATKLERRRLARV